MITALLNHLWQSTLVTCIAALLAFALHRQPARLRYSIWFAASLKFLVPFSALIAIGRSLAPSRNFAMIAPLLLGSASRVTTLIATTPPFPSQTGTTIEITPILLGVWALGSVLFALWWTIRWLHLRALVRAARPVHLPVPDPICVRLTPSHVEPGLAGILKPTVLLPEGLVERLTPQEVHSIIAHEVCHLRRRDNLTDAIHMVVRILFWYFPVTWWITNRLHAERERACDEEVVASGHAAQCYAQGILKVCQFYIRPARTLDACASGLVGAHLKQRIQHIMNSPATVQASAAWRRLLLSVLITAVVSPIFVGLLSHPAMSKQAINARVVRNFGTHRHYQQTRTQTYSPVPLTRARAAANAEHHARSLKGSTATTERWTTQIHAHAAVARSDTTAQHAQANAIFNNNRDIVVLQRHVAALRHHSAAQRRLAAAQKIRATALRHHSAAQRRLAAAQKIRATALRHHSAAQRRLATHKIHSAALRIPPRRRGHNGIREKNV